MRQPARRSTEVIQTSAEAESTQFLREFRRKMAAQGMIVRMATAGPDWEPPVSLDVPADELSAIVVQSRGGSV
jgi:hypothetical protein